VPATTVRGNPHRPPHSRSWSGRRAQQSLPDALGRVACACCRSPASAAMRPDRPPAGRGTRGRHAVPVGWPDNRSQRPVLATLQIWWRKSGFVRVSMWVGHVYLCPVGGLHPGDLTRMAPWSLLPSKRKLCRLRPLHPGSTTSKRLLDCRAHQEAGPSISMLVGPGVLH
jgi:hypothetical protein